jgi:ABC-2 type transport system ATP-binding protein
LIGTLSKGYRQRVGLADALVSDPPVLILDEPTSGLDPTQIIETRKLIADLGQSRTVLISTHILSEVEKTCTRAVVIARGKVLAQGRLADLCPPGQSLEKMFLDLVEEREAIGA